MLFMLGSVLILLFLVFGSFLEVAGGIFCGSAVACVCVLFGLILGVKLLDGVADDLRWSVACGE